MINSRNEYSMDRRVWPMPLKSLSPSCLRIAPIITTVFIQKKSNPIPTDLVHVMIESKKCISSTIKMQPAGLACAEDISFVPDKVS